MKLITPTLFTHRLAIAALLTLGVLCFYVVMIPEWSLRDQDFTSLLRVAALDFSSWDDIRNSFLYGKTLLANCPFHHDALAIKGYGAQTSFFAPYYRPLLLLWHWVQYYFFGLHAYAYFIVSVVLHAVVTGILCYLLTYAFTLGWACYGALWFACHPSLQGWIFGFDCQQNSLALLFALLGVLCGYRGAITSSRLLSIACCVFMLCSWLTRETFLALPFIFLIITWVLPAYRSVMRKLSINASIAMMLYLLWRFCVSSWVLPEVSLLSSRGVDMRSFPFFVYHLFLHQWFAWDYYFDVKAQGLLVVYRALKVLLVASTGYFFYKSTNKRTVVVVWLAGLSLCWPIVMTGFQTRYYYEALPCFIAGFMLLFSDKHLHNRRLRYIIGFFLGMVIVIHAARIVQYSRSGERYARTMYQVLTQQQFPPQYPVLIISTLDTYLPEALILDNKRSCDQLYFFPYLTLHYTSVDDVQSGIVATFVDNGLHITTTSPNVWMDITSEVFGAAPYLEKIMTHRVIDNRVYELTLVFNDTMPSLKTMQVYYYLQKVGILHRLR